MQLTYPSSTDIGYAQWLKHFAIHLPLIATRYDISESEVSTVQALAQDFLELLIYQTHCTTQAIVLRPPLLSTSQPVREPAGAGMCALLQEYIARVVQRIYKHSSYCEEDNSLLELGRFPLYLNSTSLVLSVGVGDQQATTTPVDGAAKRKCMITRKLQKKASY